MDGAHTGGYGGPVRYSWPGFELDPDRYELTRDGEIVELQPLVIDVLTHLVIHRDRIVTKEELLDNVWGDRFVSESALTTQIKFARRAVGDDGERQAVIKTVFGRGYRFVAAVSERDLARPPAVCGSDERPARHVVGRSDELVRLDRLLTEVENGSHRIAFIGGEAGIGKTTLVETFLARVRVDQRARVGVGNAIPQRGAREAYLPLLDALADLGHSDARDELAAVLAAHAPMWLLQLGWLGSPGDLDAAGAAAARAGPGGMLHELLTAIDQLTVDRPLVIVLEDMHWSDPSTLDAIDALARRRSKAKVLVVVTYRPTQTDDRAGVFDMARTLVSRDAAAKLNLGSLASTDVDEIVTARIGDVAGRDPLVDVLSQRTGGVPFFVHEILDLWLDDDRARVTEAGLDVDDLAPLIGVIPSSVTSVVGETIGRLPRSLIELLEAASVAGPTFSAAVVASTLGRAPGDVERELAAVAERRVVVEALGEEMWPDLSASSRFGFVHDLYREVLYQQLTAARRIEIHRSIGRRLEQAYAADPTQAATELATHFVAGRDVGAAVRYAVAAADIQLSRGAHREATVLLRSARELVVEQPPSGERDRDELELLVALGAASLGDRGYAAQETIEYYEQARRLGEQLGTGDHLLPVYFGLWKNANGVGELDLSCDISATFLDVAERGADRAGTLVAHRARAWSLMHLGELAAAKAHFDQILSYDGALILERWAKYSEHPIIAARSGMAWLMWITDRQGPALEHSATAIGAARTQGHPLTLSYTLFIETVLRQWYGDVETTTSVAHEARRHADLHGFELWGAWAHSSLGWAMVHQGDVDQGLAELEAGLDEARTGGPQVFRAYFMSVYGDALRAVGRVDDAIAVVGDALQIARHTHERFAESDLLRQRGELLVLVGQPSDAEAAFGEAIGIAASKGWTAFERRAHDGLAALRARSD